MGSRIVLGVDNVYSSYDCLCVFRKQLGGDDTYISFYADWQLPWHYPVGGYIHTNDIAGYIRGIPCVFEGIGIIMRKSYKYRLYPTSSQKARFEETLGFCCQLYNAAMQERREAWYKNHIHISMFSQNTQLSAIKESCPEYKDIYAQVLQNVLWRVNRVYDAYFRRIQEGEKPKLPRFRGTSRYDSFTYPQSLVNSRAGTRGGFYFETGRLRLSKIGAIKFKQHRPIEGEIKTLTIKREANKWYAIFACVTNAKPLVPCNKAVGLDMGIESFVATSDGEFFNNPRYFRANEKEISDAQRILSRRKKGSKRHSKARALVHQHYIHVSNQRKDFHHKLARNFIDKYGFIALEDLNIDNMVRNKRLSKSISDAAWGQFASILLAKAEEAGRDAVLVSPYNTSQICSRCGTIVPKGLGDRWHICPVCGLSMHRDTNSACNVLGLGLSLRGYPEKLPVLTEESGHVGYHISLSRGLV